MRLSIAILNHATSFVLTSSPIAIKNVEGIPSVPCCRCLRRAAAALIVAHPGNLLGNLLHPRPYKNSLRNSYIADHRVPDLISPRRARGNKLKTDPMTLQEQQLEDGGTQWDNIRFTLYTLPNGNSQTYQIGDSEF
ncbi:hypothetical protein DFLDMN_006209 (plasmid) [Cupriavidus sp. H19C3]